jgi:hypothetical protein
MEDLRSLMTCLDDISSKIPDGIYLEMANTMKRVHDHMNGNKSIHEDIFYGDDDDAIRSRARERAQENEIRDIAYLAQIRNDIKVMVMRMRGEFKWLKKLDKDVTKTVQIKRMTAHHKSEAIKIWCEAHFLVGEVLPNVELHEWDTVSEAIFVGCVSSVGATEDGGWTWKNLVEWGLRMIVLEIGTEDEIERAKEGLMFRDDLSLETLQKLPAFEKKIYTDFKESENKHRLGIVEVFNQKIKGTEEELLRLQDACLGKEARLRRHGAHVECRAFWDASRRTMTEGIIRT